MQRNNLIEYDHVDVNQKETSLPIFPYLSSIAYRGRLLYQISVKRAKFHKGE